MNHAIKVLPNLVASDITSEMHTLLTLMNPKQILLVLRESFSLNKKNISNIFSLCNSLMMSINHLLHKVPFFNLIDITAIRYLFLKEIFNYFFKLLYMSMTFIWCTIAEKIKHFRITKLGCSSLSPSIENLREKNKCWVHSGLNNRKKNTAIPSSSLYRLSSIKKT